MKKEYIFLGLVILLIGIISIFEFLTSQKQSIALPTIPVKVEKRIDKVTATIESLPDQSDSAKIAFLVALDTHSENLDTFDFSKDLSIVKNGKTIPASAVQNREGAGHHRRAQVFFPAMDPPFTIVVFNVSGVSRTEITFQNE